MLVIREIVVADAQPAAELSGELGYPVTTEEIAERIAALKGLENHVVYVACLRDNPVGWIDIGVVHHLQAEPYGEIGGLVVASTVRNGGIGRQLLARAEQWVRDRGVKKILVRSRISREDAHRFYVREGYEQTKTSAVFSKSLV
ncbi:MAG: GNAT family N-acetyltransferase [Acidobacteriaceae bacterium]|nr:GNAT family N-acetyltransferase [Acidobacteriaceae bacterium]MBV9499296.1 GNAT family N-acetyltransferase [Acidobacteriaceae bacterium]